MSYDLPCFSKPVNSPNGITNGLHRRTCKNRVTGRMDVEETGKDQDVFQSCQSFSNFSYSSYEIWFEYD